MRVFLEARIVAVEAERIPKIAVLQINWRKFSSIAINFNSSNQQRWKCTLVSNLIIMRAMMNL